MVWADEVAAINAQADEDGLWIALYPTRPLAGILRILAGGDELARFEADLSPATPASAFLIPANQLPDDGPIEIRLEDNAGRAFFRTIYSGQLR